MSEPFRDFQRWIETEGEDADRERRMDAVDRFADDTDERQDAGGTDSPVFFELWPLLDERGRQYGEQSVLCDRSEFDHAVSQWLRQRQSPPIEF